MAVAAQKTYVAPGDLDEYYFFASGGHSGQIYVYGVPSMRHLSTVPVFTPYPATGYGFDDESKKMLGNLTWGDVHHPSLSETNGDYDGRWLFINDMPNARIARIADGKAGIDFLEACNERVGDAFVHDQAAHGGAALARGAGGGDRAEVLAEQVVAIARDVEPMFAARDYTPALQQLNWRHNWDFSVQVLSAGDVILRGPGGADRRWGHARR